MLPLRRFFSTGKPYDIGIVGGGPAGTASAVSALYEGYRVALFDKNMHGGGACKFTPEILNVPGFPRGVSGQTLSLSTLEQVQNLGGSYFQGREVKKISREGNLFILHDEKERHIVRSVILAPGVLYKRLPVPSVEKFEHSCLYYQVEDRLVASIREASTPIHIAIIGGGNSAGQGALFYASHGAKVTLIHRNDGLFETMSRYLIQRLVEKNVTIVGGSNVIALEASPNLKAISIKHKKTLQEALIPIDFVFALIGAHPPTLPETDSPIRRDDRGYIRIMPPSHMTSLPGIFAAGDATSKGAGRILLAEAQGVQAFIQAAMYLTR